jgi:hypothetical protein
MGIGVQPERFQWIGHTVSIFLGAAFEVVFVPAEVPTH